MDSKSRKSVEICTMEEFQKAKIEDRRELARLSPAEAQRHASAVPLNAILTLKSLFFPSHLVEDLLNGKQLV